MRDAIKPVARFANVISDYLKHLMIRTPLESPALRLQLLLYQRRLRHVPELRDISSEPDLITRAVRRVLSPSSNCIDVGSHLGLMLSCFIKGAPDGRHIAFEPTPRKARWLRRKFPEVDVRELALGDRSGKATLFINGDVGADPLDSPSAHNSLRGAVGSETLTVDCARLDDVLPEEHHVNFIKIDVEGGELAVLRGAVVTLNRCHPTLLFESSNSCLGTFGLTTAEVFGFLEQQGYAILLVKDFLENGEPLTLDRFDQAHRYPFKAFNFIAVPG